MGAMALFLFVVEAGTVLFLGLDLADAYGERSRNKKKAWFLFCLFFWIVHTCISLVLFAD